MKVQCKLNHSEIIMNHTMYGTRVCNNNTSHFHLLKYLLYPTTKCEYSRVHVRTLYNDKVVAMLPQPCDNVVTT